MTDSSTELTPEQLQETANTLLKLTAHLRSGPAPEHALALTAVLLDEDHGVLARLSEALRATSRYLVQQAPVPWTPQVQHAVQWLTLAANDIQDWTILHFDVSQLRTDAVLSQSPS
ncbi:hypothetical protein OTB20_18790 [Streptomyces sp. H27-H1]|uniref:hypothetical protein n=1 Tax=Streptomyces sp. H27-H1 TaxID=2996461 RepID=UPI002271F59A|nr:hypothetical protein [Streptomyces sp. H27-H1]MCY0928205.1 hypothetical protein [Streptomyces sp. H27-H1]